MKLHSGLLAVLFAAVPGATAEPARLKLDWEGNMLTIRGEKLPGGEIVVHYLEAYCRDGSHTADWKNHTVVGHRTRLVSRNAEGTELRLQCKVNDGLVVDHLISTTADEVDFRLTARNPTEKRSEAHWAQPCIRVGRFTGTGKDVTDDKYAYVRKSFVFLGGKLVMMPTPRWATEARYVPGQVWAAPGIPRGDVNPRPLHPEVPSNGLIGCFSGDETMIFATAFEPYQELFQGVIRCLHADFRLGGLEPGATLEIRGKIYVVDNDLEALLRRYERDFPEHSDSHAARGGRER